MMYLIQKLVEMAKKHSNIFFISEKQLNNCEISFDLIRPTKRGWQKHKLQITYYLILFEYLNKGKYREKYHVMQPTIHMSSRQHFKQISRFYLFL